MSAEPLPPDHSDYAPEIHLRASLREVYFVLLKHRWPVIAVILATWLFAFISKYTETPTYRATALIQIDWGKINVVQDVMVNPTRTYADVYGTQEKIVNSRQLTERVVEDLELWEHPLFAPDADAPIDQEKLVSNIGRSIQGMVKVSRVKKTQLMEVSFVSPDPELSAQLANALVVQYRQFNVDSESGLARATSSFIDEEISELRNDIQERERLLREYSRKNQIVIAEDENKNIVLQRLETLNEQLAQAGVQRATAEARYTNLRNADPFSLDEVRTSGPVRDLERRYLELNERHSELAATFGPDWPEIQRVKGAMEETKRDLSIAATEQAAKVVGTAKGDFQEAQDRESLLQKSLSVQKSQVRDLAHAASDYGHIKAELANQRQILRGLLRRRSETDIAADLGERQPVRVKVIERAETPMVPFAPGSNRRFALFIVLGIVLGGGAAYVLDHWDDAIHTVDDVKQHIPLPYLGMIPRYGNDSALTSIKNRLALRSGASRGPLAKGRDAKRSSYLPTIYDHRPALAEHRDTLNERFRFLRGSMLLSTPNAVPKIVLVTSPDKNCGKTFVSSNLSCSLGQLDKKVLLIDSDLRNPRLHRVFRYRNRVGLSNVLTGQLSLKDGCIMRTEIPNLYLMMSGPKSPNPGELLASPAMERTLKECAEHFDFVVLDSAPLLPVFDSHVLSTRCDGVILVTRAGVTSRHAAKQSVELVERVNGKITGLVLNDVDIKDYAQYYYHSHYAYETGTYTEDEQTVGIG